jgi:plasmid stability protein
MANITIRNIPDDVFAKIKRLSSIEKRSINNELLVIIERGTHSEIQENMKKRKSIPKSIQVNLWKNLSRKWEDTRSTNEILADIYEARTMGREFRL